MVKAAFLIMPRDNPADSTWYGGAGRESLEIEFVARFCGFTSFAEATSVIWMGLAKARTTKLDTSSKLGTM